MKHGNQTRRMLLAGLLAWAVTGAATAADEPALPPVPEGPYSSDCGRCHIPFSAGLLPALSWERIMFGLKDHFGQPVELSPQSTRAIYDYLLTNAAGRVTAPTSVEIMNNVGSDPAPLRITDTGYFRQRHDSALRQRAEASPAVKTMSDCGACHPRAAQGVFNAAEARTP